MMPGICCNATPRKLVVLAAIPLGVIVACVAAGLLGVRLNATPSVATGLYVVTSDQDAPFVEFCPPEPFGTESVQRGYRRSKPLTCADGGEALLKPVVAHAGDVVGVSVEGLRVNGQAVANTAARSHDTFGRPLRPWPAGSYTVQYGTIWVASSYSSRSYDSRYFGPVNLTAVRHHLKPLVTE